MVVRTAIPEVQRDIDLIADLLRTLEIGQTLSYAMILHAVGGNGPLCDYRYRIDRARRRVEKEGRMVFATLPKSGVTRMPDTHIPVFVAHAGQKAARAARRGVKRGRLHVGRLTGRIARETRQRIDMLGGIASLTRLKMWRLPTSHAEDAPTLPTLPKRTA